MFIHPAPGGGGAGRGRGGLTAPFRSVAGGRPRNGVWMGRGPGRGSAGGSTGQRLLALPRRSRHEKRGLHCPCLFYTFFFLQCLCALPPRAPHTRHGGGACSGGGLWWGWVGRCSVGRVRAPCRCISPAPLSEQREYIQFGYRDLIDHLACPQLC